jgi:hypothetical protein
VGHAVVGQRFRPQQLLRSLAARRPLQEGEAAVGGDPVQPGAHRAVAVVEARLERGPRLPRAQPGLLDDVLGVGQRAEHAVAVRGQLAPERVDGGGELGLDGGRHTSRIRRGQPPAP